MLLHKMPYSIDLWPENETGLLLVVSFIIIVIFKLTRPIAPQLIKHNPRLLLTITGTVKLRLGSDSLTIGQSKWFCVFKFALLTDESTLRLRPIKSANILFGGPLRPVRCEGLDMNKSVNRHLIIQIARVFSAHPLRALEQTVRETWISYNM